MEQGDSVASAKVVFQIVPARQPGHFLAAACNLASDRAAVSAQPGLQTSLANSLTVLVTMG